MAMKYLYLALEQNPGAVFLTQIAGLVQAIVDMQKKIENKRFDANQSELNRLRIMYDNRVAEFKKGLPEIYIDCETAE